MIAREHDRHEPALLDGSDRPRGATVDYQRSWSGQTALRATALSTTHDGRETTAMSAPPPPVEAGGGLRRFSLGAVASSLSASVEDVRQGATRLADLAASELSSVFDAHKLGAADEIPAVLSEPEPETLAGWEARARSLEAHWRVAAEQAVALRSHAAAQQERIIALQAEADMAQAYAAQVSALEDEILILKRNEQALRQRQLLAQHATGDQQGEVIKLLQGELRDMQLQLRAVAKQSREQQNARAGGEAAAAPERLGACGGQNSMDHHAPPAVLPDQSKGEGEGEGSACSSATRESTAAAADAAMHEAAQLRAALMGAVSTVDTTIAESEAEAAAAVEAPAVAE